MSIKIIDGNLFDSKARIIAHQVNCQGKMNSGVAKEVRQRYPHVYDEYARKVKECRKINKEMLGITQFVPTDANFIGIEPGVIGYNGQYIANLFAQKSYGYDGKCYTDILALQNCFTILANAPFCKNNFCGCTIAMPYKIGCVRGGANWDEVYSMIEKTFKNVAVELWRLDKG